MWNFRYIYFFLLFYSSAFSQRVVSDSTIVATVDGEPIIGREFNLVSRKYKSIVIQEFRHKYNLNYNNQFWENYTSGESPTEILYKKTLDAIIQIKVQQILAIKLGIVQDIGFDGFLKNLEKENKTRMEAKQNQKVIFGPTQYTEEVYYDYVFSNLVIKIKNILETNELMISNATLKSIYERDKDSLYRMKDDILVHKVEIIQLIPSDSIKSVIFSLAKKMKNEITKGNALFSKDKYLNNKWKVGEEELIFSPTSYLSNEDESSNIIYQLAQKLTIGEISEILESPNGYIFFKVIKKKSMGYFTFDSCKNSIKRTYLDSIYTDYVKVLTNNAIIVHF